LVEKIATKKPDQYCVPNGTQYWWQLRQLPLRWFTVPVRWLTAFLPAMKGKRRRPRRQNGRSRSGKPENIPAREHIKKVEQRVKSIQPRNDYKE